MKKLLLASSFLCAMSGYALAADAVVEVPEVYVAPVFSWTGGYIGAQVGYLWGDIWTRPHLSIKERQLITIAVNIALARPSGNIPHYNSARRVPAIVAACEDSRP